MLVCVHLKNLHLSFPLFRSRQRHQAKSIEGIQHQHSTGTLSKPKTTQNLGWRVVGHLNGPCANGKPRGPGMRGRMTSVFGPIFSVEESWHSQGWFPLHMNIMKWYSTKRMTSISTKTYHVWTCQTITAKIQSDQEWMICPCPHCWGPSQMGGKHMCRDLCEWICSPGSVKMVKMPCTNHPSDCWWTNDSPKAI